MVKFRRPRFINAQLHDWNVRFREDVTQHGPRAVIEAPGLIELNRCWRKKFSNTMGKVGTARSGIFHFVKFPREAAKVMDCSRRRHCRYCRAGKIPVCRNAEHSIRAWNRMTDRRPTVSVGILQQCIHRIAVSEENSGHWFSHFKSSVGSREANAKED